MTSPRWSPTRLQSTYPPVALEPDHANAQNWIHRRRRRRSQSRELEEIEAILAPVVGHVSQDQGLGRAGLAQPGPARASPAVPASGRSRAARQLQPAIGRAIGPGLIAAGDGPAICGGLERQIVEVAAQVQRE